MRLAKSLRSGGSQKLAQTQDAAYVTARIQTEQKAIDRLKASLQLLEDEDDLVPTASTSTTAPGAFDVSDSGSGSGDNDALAALPSHVRNHLYKAKAKKPAATSTLGLLAITGAKAKAKAKSKSKKKKGKKKKKDKSKSKNKSKKGKKRKRTDEEEDDDQGFGGVFGGGGEGGEDEYEEDPEVEAALMRMLQEEEERRGGEKGGMGGGESSMPEEMAELMGMPTGEALTEDDLDWLQGLDESKLELLLAEEAKASKAAKQNQQMSAEEQELAMLLGDDAYLGLDFGEEGMMMEAEGGRSGLSAEQRKAVENKRHVIFVDDDEEVANFDPAEYYDTAPELVRRKFNRPRIADLVEDEDFGRVVARAERPRMQKRREAAYAELAARMERLDELYLVLKTIQLRRQLDTKGKRRKVKEARPGQAAVYKWERVRKR